MSLVSGPKYPCLISQVNPIMQGRTQVEVTGAWAPTHLPSPSRGIDLFYFPK